MRLSTIFFSQHLHDWLLAARAICATPAAAAATTINVTRPGRQP